MGVELRTSHVSRSTVSSSFLQSIHAQSAIKQHLHHRSAIKFHLLRNKVSVSWIQSVSDETQQQQWASTNQIFQQTQTTLWFSAIYPFCESKHCDHNQIRLIQVTRDTKLEDYSGCWCRVLVFFWFYLLVTCLLAFPGCLWLEILSPGCLWLERRGWGIVTYFYLLSVDCLLVMLWLVQGYEDTVSLVWTGAFLVCDCLISMQTGTMTFWVEHMPRLS